MTFRNASPEDASAIAALHTLSWQLNYRGIWSDEYLDSNLLDERKIYWKKKLTHPKDIPFVLLAEEGKKLCCFVCAFANHSEKWGTLIDNIHVNQSFQNRGIGFQLMQAVAIWINHQNLEPKCYLWVLDKNEAGIRFYQRHGGVEVERFMTESPGGGQSMLRTMYWEDSNKLILKNLDG